VDWNESVRSEAAHIVTGVTASTVVDQVQTQVTDSFSWEVTAVEEANPANKLAMVVHISHNGTATLDATSVKHSISNKLAQGVAIAGVAVSASLVGVGTLQVVSLQVSASVPTKFTAIRILKNMAGSNAVVGGTGGTGATGASGVAIPTTWQVKGTAYTAISGDAIMADTSVAPFTILLPANPLANDIVKIADYMGTFALRTLTVGANGSVIMGLPADMTITTNYVIATLQYIDAVVGWRLV
jgi:hypothetical protein